MPGTLSGCFLKFDLFDFSVDLRPFISALLGVNLLFFLFLSVASLGVAGSAFGNSSGCASLCILRASLCLWLTILAETAEENGERVEAVKRRALRCRRVQRGGIIGCNRLHCKL